MEGAELTYTWALLLESMGMKKIIRCSSPFQKLWFRVALKAFIGAEMSWVRVLVEGLYLVHGFHVKVGIFHLDMLVPPLCENTPPSVSWVFWKVMGVVAIRNNCHWRSLSCFGRSGFCNARIWIVHSHTIDGGEYIYFPNSWLAPIMCKWSLWTFVRPFICVASDM